MTRARPWPNNATEQRDLAAEAAVKGIRALQPLVEGSHFDGTETLRRQSIALACLHTIARCLESVGAPTRPA